MEFKVGDIVRISERSQFYGFKNPWHLDNPQSIDEYGVIDSISEDILGIGVRWDAGYHNAYDESDLVAVTIFCKKTVNKLSLV